MVFTGRTAYCNGGALASTAVKVKAPNDFKFGKLVKNPGNGTAKLKVEVPYAGKLSLSGKTVLSTKLKSRQGKDDDVEDPAQGEAEEEAQKRAQRQDKDPRQVQPRRRQISHQEQGPDAEPPLAVPRLGWDLNPRPFRL